jgi:hypothetical protein
VLDAEPASVERVPRIGDVARGEDAGDARLEALVHEDAVIHRNPRGRSELTARTGANADDDEIGRQLLSVSCHHGVDVLATPEPRDARARHERYAVLLVDPSVHLADFAAQGVLERPLGRHDHGDLVVELAERGCDLGADPAATDDDDRLRRLGGAPDPVGVADGAKRQDPGKLGARNG